MYQFVTLFQPDTRLTAVLLSTSSTLSYTLCQPCPTAQTQNNTRGIEMQLLLSLMCEFCTPKVSQNVSQPFPLTHLIALYHRSLSSAQVFCNQLYVCIPTSQLHYNTSKCNVRVTSVTLCNRGFTPPFTFVHSPHLMSRGFTRRTKVVVALQPHLLKARC
jgi:hypothetical protein